MTAMPRGPSASERPRDRLVESATRLFLEDGIRAVGIDRIVADADVALMTLYRHFGGKDELVAAAVERWGAQWLAWLEGCLHACGDDPNARLEGLWNTLGAWLVSGGHRGSLVVNAAAELRGDPYHPAHKAIAEHWVAQRRLLEELATSAGAADAGELAGQWHVMIEGLLSGVTVDRRSVDTSSVRTLANVALAASSARRSSM